MATAVAADGTKLPPKVVFKGLRTRRDLIQFPVYEGFVPEERMDGRGRCLRVDLPFLPRSPPNEKFLLVWDSFGDHLTEQVKSLLRRRTLMSE